MNPLKAFLLKWKHYEFWPYWVFYAPVFFYGVYLAIKARSLTYFTAVNPAFKHGDLANSSKADQLFRFPVQFVPHTVLCQPKTLRKDPASFLLQHDFTYPFIAKPDMGERGDGIEVIKNEAQFHNYLKNTEPFLIQEYITWSLELGIMYYRIPGDHAGTVSSIVGKANLTVLGNGKSTLKQLINENYRAWGRREYLYQKFDKELDSVVSAGKELELEPISNHKRGTKFLNRNDLICKQLNKVFDKVADAEGFYYGRFDIKTTNEEDLLAGKNILIMEINGVTAEPAHIYDPNHKLLEAWKVIIAHMDIIYRISVLNKQNGHTYASLTEVLANLRDHFFGRNDSSIDEDSALRSDLPKVKRN